MLKKCTPLWREANFEVKMLNAPHVRTSFGRSDVVSRGLAVLPVCAVWCLSFLTSPNVLLEYVSSGCLLAIFVLVFSDGTKSRTVLVACASRREERSSCAPKGSW